MYIGDYGWGVMLTCYGPADDCCNVNLTGWEADANTTNVWRSPRTVV